MDVGGLDGCTTATPDKTSAAGRTAAAATGVVALVALLC